MSESKAIRDLLEQAYRKSVHDREVLNQATAWKRTPKVLKVFADLKDWEKPPEINGYVPDVFVQGVGFQVAIEVETKESVKEQHAAEQVAAFQAWAASGPGRQFELQLAD